MAGVTRDGCFAEYLVVSRIEKTRGWKLTGT